MVGDSGLGFGDEAIAVAGGDENLRVDIDIPGIDVHHPRGFPDVSIFPSVIRIIRMFKACVGVAYCPRPLSTLAAECLIAAIAAQPVP